MCGLTYRMSEMRKRWDGALVCPPDFETRHPQDFSRAARDVEAVKNARPRIIASTAGEAMLEDSGVDPVTEENPTGLLGLSMTEDG